jgi:hypothetical protein
MLENPLMKKNNSFDIIKPMNIIGDNIWIIDRPYENRTTTKDNITNYAVIVLNVQIMYSNSNNISKINIISFRYFLQSHLHL